MKRLLILLLATIICVTSSIVPVAAEVTDSLNLSAEEKTQLNLFSDETVVKLFGGMFMGDFSEKKDIASIVSESQIMYLTQKRFGKIVYKKYYEGEMVELNPATGISDWSDFYKYAVYPNKVFDSSVTVKKVYCLNGEASRDGVYIYYDTDQGEYILYKEYLSADETYLFPLSTFYEFAETVYSERLLYKDYDGGRPEIDNLFDMENYLFKPRGNLYLIAGIVGVVIAAGGVLFGLFLRKAKKRQNRSANRTY